MSKDYVESAEKPSLSFTDLMSLSLAFNSRLDTLWQRVLYTHAAIVGVMVFFGTTQDLLPLPRLLVFFFYTFNIGVTIAAFSECYSGLRAVLDDLKSFPESDNGTNTQIWVMERSYNRHAMRRVLSLGAVWFVLGYLLVYPVFVDFWAT